MLDRSFYEKADEILSVHGKGKESLIPILQDIQTVYRYIPPDFERFKAQTRALIYMFIYTDTVRRIDGKGYRHASDDRKFLHNSTFRSP